MVHNVLSKDECLRLIELGEAQGFESIENEYDPKYRNNQRVSLLDQDFAQEVYRRLEAAQEFKDLSNFSTRMAAWVELKHECRLIDRNFLWLNEFRHVTITLRLWPTQTGS